MGAVLAGSTARAPHRTALRQCCSARKCCRVSHCSNSGAHSGGAIFFVPHCSISSLRWLVPRTKFRKFLDASVPESRRKIEEWRSLCGGRHNLVDATAVAISTGSLGGRFKRARGAVSSPSCLLRPDKLFVDGGLQSNLPVAQARAMAPTSLSRSTSTKTSRPRRSQYLSSHSQRSTPRHQHAACQIDEDAVKQADVLVHPNVNGIHLLSERARCSQGHSRRGSPAEAALPKIRAA